MPEGTRIIALYKGHEKYILVFDDGQEDEALRVVGRWASHPELRLNWLDAAALAKQIREGIQVAQ